jgi:phosphate transport system permease protein
MLPLTLLGIVILALGAFAMARTKAVAAAGGKYATLHSRPGYHGLYALLCVLLAGLGVYILVSFVGNTLVGSSMRSALAEMAPDLTGLQADTALNDARAIAEGGVASSRDDLRVALSEIFASVEAKRVWAIVILSLAAAAGAAWYALKQVSAPFRARNRSEKILRVGLMLTAAVAILTTIGILLSLIGETLNFFSKIDWQVGKFLFGTTWSPLSGVHTGEMSAD